jgi:hypothetical protein
VDFSRLKVHIQHGSINGRASNPAHCVSDRRYRPDYDAAYFSQHPRNVERDQRLTFDHEDASASKYSDIGCAVHGRFCE